MRVFQILSIGRLAKVCKIRTVVLKCICRTYCWHGHSCCKSRMGTYKVYFDKLPGPPECPFNPYLNTATIIIVTAHCFAHEKENLTLGFWMDFRCFDCSLFQYFSCIRLKQMPTCLVVGLIGCTLYSFSGTYIWLSFDNKVSMD